MKDDRSPEHRAIRAGIEALTEALPAPWSSYTPGEFREEVYGETLYGQVESVITCQQPDGTDLKYTVMVNVIREVDSKDDYWERQHADQSNSVVINGVHYRLGDSGETEFRGFGGRKFDIEFLGGRKVSTRNLWYQGPIPPKYLERFPDNARWTDPGQEPFGGRRDR